MKKMPAGAVSNYEQGCASQVRAVWRGARYGLYILTNDGHMLYVPSKDTESLIKGALRRD